MTQDNESTEPKDPAAEPARKPTYGDGVHVVDRNGAAHEVWKTVWRDFGEAEPVELVLTVGGSTLRADTLTRSGGAQDCTICQRAAAEAAEEEEVDDEEDIVGVIDASGLADVCPRAILDIRQAARALDQFRITSPDYRQEWLAQAEYHAQWATAQLFARSGMMLSRDAWLVVVRYAVEMVAQRHQALHAHVTATEAPSHSLFGERGTPLEAISQEGHLKVLEAGYLSHTRRVSGMDSLDERIERAVDYTAAEFAARCGSGSIQDWTTIVEYLIGLHVDAIRARSEDREAELSSRSLLR